MIGSALDRALDWAVVPGYTSIGYRLRRRGWEAEPGPDALDGARVLLTGAGSGIGERASEDLARLGARVHMLGRDAGRTEAARERVASRLREAGRPEASARLEVEVCDVSDLAAVRRFAAGFAERVPALNGLIHNAGALLDRRSHSPQGYELTLATHVLGPLLLTRLLMASLMRATPSRVVFVTSGGMYTARVHADDLELEQQPFDGARFYAHAKRVQVILVGELDARYRGSGVGFSLMHPGWVDTPGVRRSLPRFRRAMRPLLRDAAQGADTLVWLMSSPEAIQRPGLLWHDRRPRPLHRVPWTRESEAERDLVWRQLIGLTQESSADGERVGVA